MKQQVDYLTLNNAKISLYTSVLLNWDVGEPSAAPVNTKCLDKVTVDSL